MRKESTRRIRVPFYRDVPAQGGDGIKRLSRHLFQRLGDISIRNKIFVLNAVIIVVSVTVFAYFATRISNNAIIDKATRNATRELALIDKSLSTLVTNAEDSIRILTTNDRLQKALGEYDRKGFNPVRSLDISNTLSSVISSMVTPNTQYAAASIMTAGNALFDIGYADNDRVRDILTPERTDAILRKKIPTWIPLQEMTFRSGYAAPVFTIAKPIVGLDTGRTLGTAALYLEEADIAAIYLENIVNPNDRFLILDSDLRVLSSPRKNDLYLPLSDVQPLTDSEQLRLLQTGSILKPIGGEQVLLTMRTFAKLDWRILSMIPLKEITTEIRGISRLIVIVGASCLLFAFAASYLLSHTITRPILSLARLMKEMNRGNLDVRTEITSKDEIGGLGDGFNRLMDMTNQLLEQVRKEQTTKHEIEFQLLQSQIKPHFLYNSMETIISFIKLGMREQAMLTARSLATFYRMSLSQGQDIITIRDEIQLTASYLTIQRLRYVEMDYEINMPPEILDCQIPKLTLQPLVENAIYHGLKPRRDKGMLRLNGYLEENRVRLRVTDNGVGMDPVAAARLTHGFPDGTGETGRTGRAGGTGFGLASVDTRLKLMYGSTAGLTVTSARQEGTTVTVCLPARRMGVT